MDITLMIVPVYLVNTSDEMFFVRAMQKSYPQSTDFRYSLVGNGTIRALLRKLARDETIDALWMPHVLARNSFKVVCKPEQWDLVRPWLVASVTN